MSFPEEPLDLSPAEGGGYYPATIQQKLNRDKYQIVRKLGYGPRSSTWLVYRESDPTYFALKIFTVAATEQATRVELPLLRAIAKINSLSLPVFHGNFSETSEHGSHLCILLNPLSSSVESLRLSASNHTLPVHVVQRIVRTVADTLTGLHDAKIMHGAVKADNFLFWRPQQAEYMKPVLDSEPAPIITKVKKYLTVRSQPLNHNYKWNDKRQKVADWTIHLENFGHAQRSNYSPEPHGNYLDAPETLLQDATCSTQVDIWMLGYTTFQLLTGRPPFYAKGSVSERIAIMGAVLGDDIPKNWRDDKKMKGYNETPKGPITSIEIGLADSLHKDDVPGATAFIRACLRLDPGERLTAESCSNHEWLAAANACSCGFC